MFDNLQERFEKAFQVLKGHGQITEVNVGETLKEVRKALLDADVDYKTAKEFTARVKEKALGQEVLTSIKPGPAHIKLPMRNDRTDGVSCRGIQADRQSVRGVDGWPSGGR